MFETVAPETFRPRNRSVFYKTLPISIAVHLVAIGVAVASMIWSVVFPTQSPKMTVAYSLMAIPDPPPPPPPPPPKVVEAPKPVLTLAQLAPPAPTQIVAPTIIPDKIPDVVPPPPTPPPAAPPPPTAAPAAVDAGAANGVKGGQAGGTGHGIGIAKGITLGDDGRVYIDRSINLPLKEVDHQYPHYPESARKARLEGKCVVRYTIGKNGKITDIAILDHAAYPIFDEETLNTVRSWRYRPMMVSGQAVEVVHEIEVSFEYIVR
jgi:protein TonB